MKLEAFRRELLTYYDTSKRTMPWRLTREPYAILVSETMLQQTQVKTVIPYYQRFMQRYPNLESLATAEEQELLKMWQGLGYYRRARNLQKAAQQIVSQFGGIFPRAKEDIESLKGVGPYTSAALASIAFEQAYACVDGNVIRLISRLDANDQDVTSKPGLERIRSRADQLLSTSRPGDFNQAMMELGAVVCTPRKPTCMTCPVAASCQTWQRGEDPQLRPFKTKRIQPSRISLRGLLLFSGTTFLLARRPEQGLMAGMWELPTQSTQAFQEWTHLLDGQYEELPELPAVQHRFTHLHATYLIRVGRVQEQIHFKHQPKAYVSLRWVSLLDLAELPLTKVFSGLLPQLKELLQAQKQKA